MSDSASPPPEELAALLNSGEQGFNKLIGLRYVRIADGEVVAELDVGAQHHQPHGIVHGGVYASLVETVASVAAGYDAMKRGLTAVGLENHTSFLHAVREGVLRATARPLTRGRRTQVWEVDVVDGSGRLCARGSVRLLCLDPESQLAGKPAGSR